MKRRFFLSLVWLMMLAACGNGEAAGPATATATDSSRPAVRQNPMPAAVPLKDSAKKDTGNPFQYLPGNWALAGDDNTTFVIEARTITYPATFKSYRYSVKGDSLKVRYDDYEGRFLVAMRGRDTLVLTGDEEQVYYRVKQ